MADFNPYQAPSALVDDVPMGELQIAERGTRLGAKILDGLIGGGIVGIAAAIAIPAMLASRKTGTEPAFIGVMIGIMGLGVIGICVWNAIWIHKYGQTIGKRILKIKIIRTDGSRVSLGRVIGLRWLPMTVLSLIPVLGFLITLTNALLIFRDSNQCLHDQFADTLVVKAE